jgi:threonine/homoserine/homoserine lactone efflux protein
MQVGIITALLSASFVAALSGAMMPGPVLTATVAQTLRRGRWAGSLIVLGHAFPELAILALLLTRGEALLRQPMVLGAVGILGGLCLLMMGIDNLRHRKQAIQATEQTLAGDGKGYDVLRHPVSAGILLSVSNPYWLLWWATLGLGMAGQALDRLGLAGLVVFFIGHIAADLVWYTGVSFVVAVGRRKSPPAFFQGVFTVCGVAMLLLAAKFLWDGIQRFI